jgi:hypothetical protein
MQGLPWRGSRYSVRRLGPRFTRFAQSSRTAMARHRPPRASSLIAPSPKTWVPTKAKMARTRRE